MTIKITKQLATMEDLAIGTGTVVQERNGVPLTLTKIDLITKTELASDPSTGGGALLVNGTVIRATSVADLNTETISGMQYSVKGYHSDSNDGGGIFYWDALKDKADHDGGVVIDPTKAFPDFDTATNAEIRAWYSATGTGTGAFVRVYSGYPNAEFWGTKRSALAFQSAMDFCLAEQEKLPTITARYWLNVSSLVDLTGYTINISEEGFGADPIYISGGNFYKGDAGFMFSRNTQSNAINSTVFHGCKFNGAENTATYVVDGDTSIRQGFYGCAFRRMSAVKSSNYTQSVRVMSNCEIYQQSVSFIEAEFHIDINITGNSFETGSAPILRGVDTLGGTNYGVTGGIIKNNLIEGLTQDHAIEISSAVALTIDDNYTELNKGLLKIIKTSGLYTIRGVSVSGNFIAGPAGGAFDIDIDQDIVGTGVKIERNTTNRTVAQGGAMLSNGSFAFRLTGDFESNRNIAGSALLASGETGGARLTTNGLDAVFSEVSTGSGVEIEWSLFSSSFPIIGYVGNQYLVTVKSIYGSSTNYRATFVGILSIVGQYDATLGTTAYAYLKSIVARSIDGSTQGAEGTNFSVVFADSGNTEISSNDIESGVKIRFPDLTLSADRNFTNASIKSLDRLLIAG